MPPRPVEGRTQQEVLHLLKYAIDTAIAYPGSGTITKARDLIAQYPIALRSSHLRHNLGDRRWKWINDQGLYPAGSAHEIAGMTAMKGTAEPDITT
jgi:hypothetical protein